MAGRPAAARSGSSGLLYGLITFAILAVLFAGLGIFAFANLNKAQQEAEQAKERLASYGNPPSFFADAARAGGRSVFQVMDGYRRDLAVRVAGDPDAVAPAIEERADELLTQIAERHPEVVTAEDALLTVVVSLDRALQNARTSVREMDRQIKNLQDENQSLSRQVKAARDEFTAQIASLREELAQVRERSQDSLAAKDQQLSQIQASADATSEEYNKARVEWQQAEREFRNEVFALTEKLNELQTKVAEQQQRGFDPKDILTKADARVIEALPGSDIVYISIGRRQNVKPGMTFEVYPQAGGNPTEARGKGSIEVATVMEQSAECVVKQQRRGQPIVVGDYCANIAFEPNRQPKFVIRGEFDLNYDGRVDPNGVEKIKSMIRTWGGQVVDELNESTDFVVIGQAPFVPRLQPGQQASKVVESLVADQELALGEHRETVEKAQGMYIPVITQTQFLYLMGQPLGETY